MLYFNQILTYKFLLHSVEEYSKTMQSNTQETGELKPDTSSSKEAKAEDTTKEDPVYLSLAKKSYDSLMRGVKAFAEVQDNVNLAFLYCNMGRFMRFRAHLHLPDEK